jgi:hypothetical protein
MEGLANWLGSKIDAFIAWLRGVLISLLEGIVGVLKDFAVWVVDEVGGAVVGVLNAIELPAFVSGGLQSVFGAVPAPIAWIAGELQVGTCLAIIGAAYVVRLIRIFGTLFQWS